jgi:hypothetical protein
LIAALASAAGTAHAGVGRLQPLTSHRAELRVLGSPRLFWRWGGTPRRFVDPKTRLMRTGTKAACRPAGRLSFVCVVRNREDALRIRYVGRTNGAFMLLRH